MQYRKIDLAPENIRPTGPDAAVHALALFADLPYRAVLDQLIEIAVLRADMPAKCVGALYRQHGFARTVPDRMTVPADPAFVSRLRSSGATAAIVRSGEQFSVLRLQSDESALLLGPEDARGAPVSEIWLPGAAKRAPRPVRSSIWTAPQDTPCYHGLNVNPKQRNVGDCVLRALSVLLDQSWEKTLRDLAGTGTALVNAQHVFEAYLKARGAVIHPPPEQNGRRLTAAAFCRTLWQTRRNGACVAALVGRRHIAVFAPGGAGYQVLDSWNCTNRRVGAFYTLQPQPLPQTERTERFSLTQGLQIRHPRFGTGKILHIRLTKGPTILSVRFSDGSIRELDASWVSAHCGQSPA